MDAVVRAKQLNRLSGFGVVLLSVTALVVVLSGYTMRPLADEGTGAHIFQLSIVALVPVALVHVATADWTRPVRSVRALALAAVVTTLAFAALYYLERVYYPAHLT